MVFYTYRIRFLVLFFIALSTVSQAQDWQWAKKMGGMGFEHGQSIVLDGNGGLYVSGTFELEADFGDTLVSAGHSDIFISKYDTIGNRLWTRQASGEGKDYSLGMAADTAGIYLTGFFEDSLHFGATAIGAEQQDVFVVRYDTSGTLRWAKKFGGWGFDAAYDMARDTKGNLYIAGVYSDTFQVDTFHFYKARWRGIFLMKLDAEGNVDWVKGSSGQGQILVNALTLDADDNVYLTGEFSGENVIDGDTIKGKRGIYVAKTDASGTLKWVKNWGNKDIYGFGGDIVADSSGVYVTGAYQGIGVFGDDLMTGLGETDIFLLKMAKETGELEWLERAGGLAHDKGMGLLLHKEKLYLTGWFDQQSNFADTIMTAGGGNNFFIAQYNKAGQAEWVESPIQQGLAYGKSLVADESDNFYTTGWFTRILNFPTDLLIATGEADVFIAKFRYKAEE